MPTASDPVARRREFAKRRVQAAWIVVAYLDTLWAFAAKVRAWDLAGSMVLCDRYIWDTRIDLDLRFGLDLQRNVGWRALERMCPKPATSLLFVLPMDEILRRFDIKGEAFREPEAHRRRRFDEYARLTRQSGFDVVKADRSIDEVTAQVLDLCAL